jgi:hypothetical protein
MKWTIDVETVSRQPNALDIVVHLSDCIRNRRWNLSRACHSCENWDPKHGLSNLPHRPGRGTAAVEGCSGCWYSMLDPVASTEPDVDTAVKLRLAWIETLCTKKPRRRPLTRLLRLESVADQQGFAGKRSERPESSSSFFRKHRPPTQPCPKCQSLAPVEYWWRVGRAGSENVQMVTIRCKCGTSQGPA